MKKIILSLSIMVLMMACKTDDVLSDETSIGSNTLRKAEKAQSPIKFGKDNTTLKLRLSKRPDLLTSEWDELLDESIELLNENPLSLKTLFLTIPKQYR